MIRKRELREAEGRASEYKWGYNFIMACFDDLARLVEILGAEKEADHD